MKGGQDFDACRLRLGVETLENLMSQLKSSSLLLLHTPYLRRDNGPPQGCSLAPCKSASMDSVGASFLCICPPKTIRFDDSEDSSQAEISARLQSVPNFQGRAVNQVHLPGAGAVYFPSPDLSVATEGTCFAIFKGYAPNSASAFWITECRSRSFSRSITLRRELDNYPYLVRKYCSARLPDQSVTLNQIRQAAPLSVRGRFQPHVPTAQHFDSLEHYRPTRDFTCSMLKSSVTCTNNLEPRSYPS